MKEELELNGFAVVKNVFQPSEVNSIVECLEKLDGSGPLFRRHQDLFAVRQVLKAAPALASLLFTPTVKALLQEAVGSDFFLVKSIYFDKPPASNWFVAYHQDLTISIKEKRAADGFHRFTKKGEDWAVEPPLALLEENITLRIHLDDTDEENGALKVIRGSHQKGIYRPETIDWTQEKEAICAVPAGGIMLMKPLLLHGSGRTRNRERRRVIHLEFSKQHLPNGLQWAEEMRLT
jgi:ectoine hydroxylase-related dioxygenase (phytanoyl-CoA dioxygenase family)